MSTEISPLKIFQLMNIMLLSFILPRENPSKLRGSILSTSILSYVS